jgi:hypothetical protein
MGGGWIKVTFLEDALEAGGRAGLIASITVSSNPSVMSLWAEADSCVLTRETHVARVDTHLCKCCVRERGERK